MTNELFYEYNILGNNHVDVLFSLAFFRHELAEMF